MAYAPTGPASRSVSNRRVEAGGSCSGRRRRCTHSTRVAVDVAREHPLSLEPQPEARDRRRLDLMDRFDLIGGIRGGGSRGRRAPRRPVRGTAPAGSRRGRRAGPGRSGAARRRAPARTDASSAGRRRTGDSGSPRRADASSGSPPGAARPEVRPPFGRKVAPRRPQLDREQRVGVLVDAQQDVFEQRARSGVATVGHTQQRGRIEAAHAEQLPAGRRRERPRIVEGVA